MKRITYLPQLHLGITFAWAIPMVFAAHLSTVNNLAWLVFLTTVLWTLIYDTQYAMVDKDDDIKIGIKSTAILFGDSVRLIIALLQILMIIGLVLIAYSAHLDWHFGAAIGITILVFFYQNYLTRTFSRTAYFAAFKSNGWVGLIIFLGIDLSYRLG
jgi:4-hydroxybenzoate polyprenyltransferase